MHRLHDLSELPEDLGPCVVTVGNFDGVHRGHQEVLGMVVERAQREGASSVVLTFDPHPVEVMHPERAPELIAPGALFHATRRPCTLMRINFTTTQDPAFWKAFGRAAGTQG